MRTKPKTIEKMAEIISKNVASSDEVDLKRKNKGSLLRILAANCKRCISPQFIKQVTDLWQCEGSPLKILVEEHLKEKLETSAISENLTKEKKLTLETMKKTEKIFDNQKNFNHEDLESSDIEVDDKKENRDNARGEQPDSNEVITIKVMNYLNDVENMSVSTHNRKRLFRETNENVLYELETPKKMKK